MPNPRWTHDRKLAKGQQGIVGVDEAGRGCLAGPVVAGAVLLSSSFFRVAKHRKITEEMNDSKQFNEAKREELYARVIKLADQSALIASTGEASVQEIEKYNIVGATCLAMERAMKKLSQKSRGLWKPVQKSSPDLFEHGCRAKQKWIVLVDGRPMKKLPFLHQGLVKGDGISLSVAMASMLAKVTRDRFMRKLHLEFPNYGFDSNKGYGAPVHLNALQELGPTQHHRPRFIRNLLKEPKGSQCADEQSQLSFW